MSSPCKPPVLPAPATLPKVRLVVLQDLVGQKIVVDLCSPFVCMGKLASFDDHFLEIRNADFHDLRDTETSRENYIADSIATGVKRNRKRILIRRSEVAGISLLDEVVDG